MVSRQSINRKELQRIVNITQIGVIKSVLNINNIPFYTINNNICLAFYKYFFANHLY